MNNEPARLSSALNAALIATVGILTVLDVLSEEVAGAISIALSAWVLFVGEWVRARVTPVGNARLSSVQAENLTITDG